MAYIWLFMTLAQETLSISLSMLRHLTRLKARPFFTNLWVQKYNPKSFLDILMHASWDGFELFLFPRHTWFHSYPSSRRHRTTSFK